VARRGFSRGDLEGSLAPDEQLEEGEALQPLRLEHGEQPQPLAQLRLHRRGKRSRDEPRAAPRGVRRVRFGDEGGDGAVHPPDLTQPRHRLHHSRGQRGGGGGGGGRQLRQGGAASWSLGGLKEEGVGLVVPLEVPALDVLHHVQQVADERLLADDAAAACARAPTRPRRRGGGGGSSSSAAGSSGGGSSGLQSRRVRATDSVAARGRATGWQRHGSA